MVWTVERSILVFLATVSAMQSAPSLALTAGISVAVISSCRPSPDIEFMRNISYSVEWARRIKSGSGLDSLIDCVDFKLILMLFVESPFED
jgi:hypothetical protein